jgi:hypothetical protein
MKEANNSQRKNQASRNRNGLGDSARRKEVDGVTGRRECGLSIELCHLVKKKGDWAQRRGPSIGYGVVAES